MFQVVQLTSATLSVNITSEGGEEVGWTSGTQYGGLDLAAALGLTNVGYVANSGGALHIVGRR